jgi:hypothetical protein
VQETERLVEGDGAARVLGNTDTDQGRAGAAGDLEMALEAVEITTGIDGDALGLGDLARAGVISSVAQLENQPDRPVREHA